MTAPQVKSIRQASIRSKCKSVISCCQLPLPVVLAQNSTELIREGPIFSRPGTSTIRSPGLTTSRVTPGLLSPTKDETAAAVAVAMRQKASGFIGCLELY